MLLVETSPDADKRMYTYRYTEPIAYKMLMVSFLFGHNKYLKENINENIYRVLFIEIGHGLRG